MHRSFIAGLLLLAASASSVIAADRRVVPDLGLITNIDGDNAFRADTLDQSVKLLQQEVDSYADVGVKTLSYCTGAGSEILLYPTKVANTWGWRKTSYDADPAWGSRIERNRRNMEAGGDALRTAGEQAKKRGMYFFPSQRMNDGHFAFGKPPEEYPLTGKFWLEHRDLVIGDSPIKGKAEYGNLLDFSHPQVREYRLAQTFEAIDRYQDIMDGFELDFTRFQVFFPAGKAAERAGLMTDLVRRVRQRLDEAGRANSRTYLLSVRVPPAPKNCAWAGLDVETWAKEGLIDLLTPSQMMNMGFEQPIDEFKRMLGSSGVKLYAGLLPRVGWGWEFHPKLAPALKDFGKPDRALSIPQLRGAVANSLFLGADGLYLFNFSHYSKWGQVEGERWSVKLAEPATMRFQDKVFSISKAYWFDHEDGYEYRKQLPAELASGQARTVQLLVGEDLGDAGARAAVKTCILRVGLRDASPDAAISVKLNGRPLLGAALAEKGVATFDPSNAAIAKIVKAQRDTATQMLMMAVEDLSVVRRGQNDVTVELSGETSASSPIMLTDVELGVFYGPRAD